MRSLAYEVTVVAAQLWSAAPAVAPAIPAEPKLRCENIRFEWSDIFNFKKKFTILGQIIFLTTFILASKFGLRAIWTVEPNGVALSWQDALAHRWRVCPQAACGNLSSGFCASPVSSEASVQRCAACLWTRVQKRLCCGLYPSFSKPALTYSALWVNPVARL